MQWKTRANGETVLHPSTWAAYEYAKQQPDGIEVKIYKRGQTGWQLQETVRAGDAPGASTSLTE